MHLRLVFWKTIFKGCYMRAHFVRSHMKPGQSLLQNTSVLYDESYNLHGDSGNNNREYLLCLVYNGMANATDSRTYCTDS